MAKLLSQAEQAARSILQDNAQRLVAVAEQLVHQETLTVREMAGAAGLPDPAAERVVEEPDLISPAAATPLARLHG